MLSSPGSIGNGSFRRRENRPGPSGTYRRTRRRIRTSATPYVVPQIGKILSANHLGRKMSVTDPRAAPSRSVRMVNGHVQPDTAKTMLSMRTSPAAIHVHVVMRSATPLNRA